ncbi:hypothetical protein XF_1060 [Xylella fastidiosa 9a5c]|uniref:Uncharacterized protein n=1 Tax=Xylella fastidiosa (strain 9a5c) TaxID=160492 RepID=Q9PEG8_XYLFA|nr:hypothetical protein XF_1060 [Xylella fastidiosa 9a5c]
MTGNGTATNHHFISPNPKQFPVICTHCAQRVAVLQNLKERIGFKFGDHRHIGTWTNPQATPSTLLPLHSDRLRIA